MNSKKRINSELFSVDPRGSLCLGGEKRRERIHHRDTEVAQSFTESFVKKYFKQSFLLMVMICGLLASSSGFVVAKEAQSNEDPQIEQRMKTLTEQLRCMVCQNETLDASRADLAENLRKEIREQIKAGKSDQEIIAFLTQRYGDYVLYNPPVKRTTYLLWFGPFILLIGGTVVLYRYLKNRREMIKESPLSADERKRAEDILNA
jgi:cytochrome c-type biogenesis protein CcmH